MPSDYVPILIFVLLAAGTAAAILLLTHLVGRRRPNPVKDLAYESGMPLLASSRIRFSVRFYLVAMLFTIFDIEVVFMYPWAVKFDKLGMFGFIEMMVFIAILAVGYIYIWKRGALDWE